MCVALMQLLTAPFLIGFFLAIFWSYLVVIKSWDTENQVNRYVGQSDNNAGFVGRPG